MTIDAPDLEMAFDLVGNHPAIDFLNTVAPCTSGLADGIASPERLARWLEVAGLVTPDERGRLAADAGVGADGDTAGKTGGDAGGNAAADSDAGAAASAMADVGVLREAWRDAVASLEAGRDVPRSFLDEVARHVAQRRGAPALVPHGATAADTDATADASDTAACVWAWVLDDLGWADVVGVLAASIADFLTTANPQRLRACADRQCVHHFYDTSRNGRRRWCRMAVCGNHHKVARYRAAQADKS